MQKLVAILPQRVKTVAEFTFNNPGRINRFFSRGTSMSGIKLVTVTEKIGQAVECTSYFSPSTPINLNSLKQEGQNLFILL